MKNTDKDKAIAVELPVWQAPNDYVKMSFERDQLIVEFKTWTQSANYSKYIGTLQFYNVWGVRLERNKKFSYYPNRENDKFKSCYWIINDSSWLERLTFERNEAVTDWKNYDSREYKHYIIQSHDFFIEIVSAEVEFKKIKPKIRSLQ